MAHRLLRVFTETLFIISKNFEIPKMFTNRIIVEINCGIFIQREILPSNKIKLIMYNDIYGSHRYYDKKNHN